MYSRFSGHVYSGHSDIVATFLGTIYIYSIIFGPDIVANRIYSGQKVVAQGGHYIRSALSPRFVVLYKQGSILFFQTVRLSLLSYLTVDVTFHVSWH